MRKKCWLKEKERCHEIERCYQKKNNTLYHFGLFAKNDIKSQSQKKRPLSLNDHLYFLLLPEITFDLRGSIKGNIRNKHKKSLNVSGY